MRTKQYKLYSDGKFFDVKNDVMEKKPLKDSAGRAAEVRRNLEKAFSEIKYPTKKK